MSSPTPTPASDNMLTMPQISSGKENEAQESPALSSSSSNELITSTLTAPFDHISSKDEKLAPADTVESEQKPVKEPRKPGLLRHGGLKSAIKQCRADVHRIATECRARNRKFRDVDFDIENDTRFCLSGDSSTSDRISQWPKDFQRVTDIFDEPRFFSSPRGKPSSHDIVQGAAQDCWFLAALSTLSCAPNLMSQICVSRDEEVGVYGFVFYRDSCWESVIIDDILATNIPRYEDLSDSQQELCHESKPLFSNLTRNAGKGLTFAKSGCDGETWVPLIEKAYAKFYGRYGLLNAGHTGDALEDLTGGVSTTIQTKDILDREGFWNDLTRACQDRLFACSFSQLKKTKNREKNKQPNTYTKPNIEGLFGGHAYSVLRAMKCNGKRLVVLRNPWGNSAWKGPWADGSKEWTREWLDVRSSLSHEFGDDGQFVMEYKDFLKHFGWIDQTVLFDSSWEMASSWVTAPLPTSHSPPSYDTVSSLVILTIPESADTIIALSQPNARSYASKLAGFHVALRFFLVAKGQTEPLAESSFSKRAPRSSVNLSMNLEAGTYFIYVKLESYEKKGSSSSESSSNAPSVEDNELGSSKNTDTTAQKKTDTRVRARAATRKVLALKLSRNYAPRKASSFIPSSLQSAINRDIEYMRTHKDRPRRVPKTTFPRIRKLLRLKDPKPATQKENGESGKASSFIKATPTQVTLGLKVYTRSEGGAAGAASIICRIRGEF